MATQVWGARAGAAERAVHSRHLRRLWGLPGTRIARRSWPTTWSDRASVHWMYWWQAHALDCAVDGYRRAPTRWRQRTVAALVRGVRVRNLTGWVNRYYYDDVAWLGLALQRTADSGVPRCRGEQAVATRLRAGWSDATGGGIVWRVGDDFKNVPANGAAAVFFARRGDLGFAAALVDWMAEHLVDPDTGLAWDGLRFRPDGSVRVVEKVVYSYCQGVLLGAATELATRTGNDRWTELAGRTVAAVRTHLVDDGVLRGHGGGDGGLFTGILARYLALAAVTRQLAPDTRDTARRLVLDSAEAAWAHRGIAVGGPVFGPRWSVPAGSPGWTGPERELSVQLAGWMLMEAAAKLSPSPR